PPGQPGVAARQSDVLAALTQAVERQEGIGRDLGGLPADVAGAPVVHLGERVRAPALAPRVLEHGDPIELEDARVTAALLDRHRESRPAVAPALVGPAVHVPVELNLVLAVPLGERHALYRLGGIGPVHRSPIP